MCAISSSEIMNMWLVQFEILLAYFFFINWKLGSLILKCASFRYASIQDVCKSKYAIIASLAGEEQRSNFFSPNSTFHSNVFISLFVWAAMLNISVYKVNLSWGQQRQISSLWHFNQFPGAQYDNGLHVQGAGVAVTIESDSGFVANCFDVR